MPEPTPLPDRVRAFVAAPLRFATIATSDPDGGPRQAVVWYRLEADARITINSRHGRLWPANLRRDPRCSLLIVDGGDGYTFVALSGRVVETIDDQAVAQADIADLARTYHADEPALAERLVATFRSQRRVSFRVEILAVHDHLDD